MGVDAANGAALDHTPNPVIGRLPPLCRPHRRQPRTSARAPPVRQPTPISTLTAPAQMTASVASRRCCAECVRVVWMISPAGVPAPALLVSGEGIEPSTT